MKTMRTFFVVALAALFVTACSNDDNLPDDKGGGGTQIEGNAWISLKLRSTASTRALSDTEKELGTIDESNVQDAIVLLFDAADKYLAHVNLTNEGAEGIPGQPTGLSGTAFKVPGESKYLLVVANPSSAFSARVGTLKVGDPYSSTVNAVLDATVDDVTKKKGATGRNYFMMTNATGILAPSFLKGNRDIPLHVYKTPSGAEADPLVVYVDRVVAKVRVLFSNSQIPDFIPIKATEIKWQLNVTNKKYFPASERIYTKKESQPGFNNWSWADMYQQGSYRKDPNFENSSIKWDPALDPTAQTAYNDNYNYYSRGREPSAWHNTHESLTPTADTEVEYCLENTQTEKDNTHAYTTQVLVKARCAPKRFSERTLRNGVWDKLPSIIPNPDASVNWLKMGNENYTLITLLSWIRYELWNKYSSPAPDSYTAYITEGFNTALTGNDKIEILSAADFNALPGSNFENKWTTFENQLAAKYANARKSIESKGAGVYGRITYYVEAVNYYKIVIKHDDTDKFNNELGEFGVVRNSVYDIHIGSIMRSGYPVIPNPDPETLNESDEKYLSVQININPWTWYSQKEDL